MTEPGVCSFAQNSLACPFPYTWLDVKENVLTTQPRGCFLPW